MIGHVARAVVIGAVVLAAGVAPAAAADVERHSGTLVTIDASRLVIDEVGPGKAEQGPPVMLRRTVALRPDTKFNLFMRVDAPGRFAGDFIEVALDRADLVPGDLVTVECVREGGRLVARAVSAAEIAGP